MYMIYPPNPHCEANCSYRINCEITFIIIFQDCREALGSHLSLNFGMNLLIARRKKQKAVDFEIVFTL